MRLDEILQNDNWRLLDFGPGVEIDELIFDDVPPILVSMDAFKLLISGKQSETRKRNLLTIESGFDYPTLRQILLTFLEVFFTADHPERLFNISEICYDNRFTLSTDDAKLLQDKYGKGNKLRFLRGKDGETAEILGFIMDHPTLPWTLQVCFTDESIEFLVITQVGLSYNTFNLFRTYC